MKQAAAGGVLYRAGNPQRAQRTIVHNHHYSVYAGVDHRLGFRSLVAAVF